MCLHPVPSKTTSTPTVYRFDLGLAGIIASVFNKTYAPVIDGMLPKNGAGVHLQSSQVVLLEVLSMLLPQQRYYGLAGMDKFAATLPLPVLMRDPVITPQHCNRFVISDVLDRIDEYGSAQFVLDLTAATIPREQVRSLHGDSTSFHVDHRAMEELPAFEDISELTDEQLKVYQFLQQHDLHSDRQPVNLKQGYSRDHHPDNPQVNIFRFTSRLDDGRVVIIYQSCFSGNTNDTKFFAEVIEHELGDLISRYPNIKHVVLDSAGATSLILTMLDKAGVFLVTRVPDKLSIAKTEMEKAAKGKIAFKKYKVHYCGQECYVEMAWIGQHPLKQGSDSPRMRMLLVKAEALRDLKTETVLKKAANALEKLQADAKKLDPSKEAKYACDADANAGLEELQETCKKLKFTTITHGEAYPIYKHDKPGRPAKGDLGTLIGYNVAVECEINQAAVDEAIEQELLFIIATSDPHMTAEAAFEIYHQQSIVEGSWKTSKAPGFYTDALYLKRIGRIRGTFSVVAIAQNIMCYILVCFRHFLKANNLAVIGSSGQPTQQPTWPTILRLGAAQRLGVTVTQEGAQVTGLDEDSVLHKFICSLDEEVQKYYSPEYYQQFHQALLDFGESVDVFYSNQVTQVVTVDPPSPPPSAPFPTTTNSDGTPEDDTERSDDASTTATGDIATPHDAGGATCTASDGATAVEPDSGSGTSTTGSGDIATPHDAGGAACTASDSATAVEPAVVAPALLVVAT